MSERAWRLKAKYFVFCCIFEVCLMLWKWVSEWVSERESVRSEKFVSEKKHFKKYFTENWVFVSFCEKWMRKREENFVYEIFRFNYCLPLNSELKFSLFSMMLFLRLFSISSQYYSLYTNSLFKKSFELSLQKACSIQHKNFHENI
jgi:hypothetical protein